MPSKITSTTKTSSKEETIAKAVSRAKSAGSKTKASNGQVAAFTLDDVQNFLASKKDAPDQSEAKTAKRVSMKKEAAVVETEERHESRNLGAASVIDILGYNPDEGRKAEGDEAKVPRKFKPYYKLLVRLRQNLKDEIELHSRETLKKSSKEDSGDIASYSQHLADEGTDNFDRDFAIGLVSSEQEALVEIELAIQRIFDGTYGICEVTRKRISRERLLAVPFTKYSLQGKKDLEKNKRRTVQRGGIFGTSVEDSSEFLGDDGSD